MKYDYNKRYKNKPRTTFSTENDINEFIKTLEFKEFKIAADQRKKIAQKLATIGASQRATARMLGVDHVTIGKDLKGGEKSPSDENIDTEYQEVESDDGELSPSPEKDPFADFWVFSEVQ